MLPHAAPAFPLDVCLSSMPDIPMEPTPGMRHALGRCGCLRLPGIRRHGFDRLFEYR